MTGRPKILLVGLGRFGRHHLSTWRLLARQQHAEVVGAVASSTESAEEKQRAYGLPVHAELTDELLRSVDAVDIVSPSHTHRDFVDRCLEHCHVLSEKPLALDSSDADALGGKARRLGRVLMVNHVYRYHPIAQRLKELMEGIEGPPSFIQGELLNPADEADSALDVNLEFLHLLDLLDYLLKLSPAVRHSQAGGTWNRLSLQYESGTAAMLDVGWRGAERIRRLTLRYQDRRLHCDFLDSLISDYGPQGLYKHHPVESSRPLEAAFRAFLNAIASPASNGFPDARVASRIVDLAVKTRPARRSGRPRIAVIGGGVFGATAAIEAAGLGDVTLYERHDELMTEASFGNQWRQHSGFHYPRSYDTVHEIQETKAAFEESYRDIVLPVDSYYATAARGETITKDRYFDMCRGMGLTFSVDRPPPEYLAHDQVTACLKSDESVLDFEAMRRLIRRRIEASNSIDLQLGAEVVGGELRSDGTKTLIVDRRGQRTRPAFDYVINAAYANTNLLASWMGLPLRRLRFDFCEMVVVEIDMPPISMTVLDGPFTSVVATGRDNLFILSQAEQSVLWSQTPSDGLPPKLDRPVSNRENLLRHGKRYFPVLDQARFVESRYGLRTVVAHNQDYDGRPTVVTRHGFGCWSVLGGKILTCVANVREIANEIVAAERA